MTPAEVGGPDRKCQPFSHVVVSPGHGPPPSGALPKAPHERQPSHGGRGLVMNDQAPTSPLRLGTNVWPQDRSPKAAVRGAPWGARAPGRRPGGADGEARGVPGTRRRLARRPRLPPPLCPPRALDFRPPRAVRSPGTQRRPHGPVAKPGSFSACAAAGQRMERPLSANPAPPPRNSTPARGREALSRRTPSPPRHPPFTQQDKHFRPHFSFSPASENQIFSPRPSSIGCLMTPARWGPRRLKNA